MCCSMQTAEERASLSMTFLPHELDATRSAGKALWPINGARRIMGIQRRAIAGSVEGLDDSMERGWGESMTIVGIWGAGVGPGPAMAAGRGAVPSRSLDPVIAHPFAEVLVRVTFPPAGRIRRHIWP